MASINSMVEALSSLFTTIYCGNAALALVLYDWLLCIDQEIACIWKAAGGLNAGSLVYALSRFPLMMGLVLNTATIFPLSALSCDFLVWAGNSFVALSFFSAGMFSAFRVYAVSGRKVIPTVVVLLLSSAPIINTLIFYIGFTTVEILPSPFDCVSVVRVSPQWTTRATLIARIFLIAAETIVIVITWRNRVLGIEKDRKTLGSILLRDGSLYFIILVLLNVLHISMTAVSLDIINGNESYVTIFIDPISSILTCRFILNLRQVDHSTMPSTMPLGGDIQFAAQGSRSTLPRFVASFGEPLHTPSVGLEDIDEAEDIVEYSGSTNCP